MDRQNFGRFHQQVSDGVENDLGRLAFDRNPSANSRPSIVSAAAERMRIGTSGFSSFISLAISVPVLSLRKWSAITSSIGCCLKSSKPSSPELAVSTLKPALASRSFLTRSEMSSSSIQYERETCGGR